MSDADSNPEADPTDALTWPDLAISLYDRLTGRGAEIAYEFEEWDRLRA